MEIVDMSDDIKVALIAGGVSIGLWVLSFFFEPFKEKVTSLFKLKIEHKYDEKKKIKEVISKYKMQMLYASEELNYRIWNLYRNYENQKDCWDGTAEGQVKDYYFYTFIYRLSLFYGWANKIENEMTFIDIKYADKSDIAFIKYLRLFFKLPCNRQIIINYYQEGLRGRSTDFFQYNTLKEYCDQLLKIDFADGEKLKHYIEHNEILFSSFINNICPGEDKRYRWDILQFIHILIMAFLNTYGYDYQYTSNEIISELFGSNLTRNFLWDDFIGNIIEFRMDKDKELKKIINIIIKCYKIEIIKKGATFFRVNAQ
jgi:hypothetical protein